MIVSILAKDIWAYADKLIDKQEIHLFRSVIWLYMYQR